jgi:protein SCO1/2
MIEKRNAVLQRAGKGSRLAGLAATLVFCIAMSACQPEMQAPAQRYSLKGKVVAVDATQMKLTVDGEAIPGFMGAMTMPYAVKDAKLLDGLSPGDEITARVVVSGQSAWLEEIVVTKKAANTETKPDPDTAGQFREPTIGEEVPNFELVNQDGKRIHLGQYRGKTLLVTFIYTRCPLPDFCPLMSRNFATLEQDFAKNPETYAKTHLLSISFDAKHDTPAVLRTYAAQNVPGGKPAFTHWEFAVTPSAKAKEITTFFGLFYEEQEGQIVHSLSTAVIAPNGKLLRWYHGNSWTPEQILQDLKTVPAS